MSEHGHRDTAALEAIRAKYKFERDRRIRPEGVAQYVPAAGDYRAYADRDPFAGPPPPRAPLRDLVEVLIVGAGFGGLLSAAMLKQAGIEDVRIVDAAADFGGTWYWNRYPGAQCDVDSYCYLPLLEETGYMPKERYAFAPEIHRHTRRIAEHYDLYPHAVFQTRVEEMTWDEAEHHWLVRTDRGDAIRARFVLCAIGFAHNPKLPGIPGLDRFEGKTFHTARWDYDYTGGDCHGGLTKLADKHVALIGTGATAVQVAPMLARYARHLNVFQRTPSPIDLRRNHPTDPAWFASLAPGWQKQRQDNFDAILFNRKVDADLIGDGWTEFPRKLDALLKQAGEGADVEAISEWADLERMEELRQRVGSVIADPETAEVLKPWYRYGCKRLTFSDDYLPTFNRANVTLVDTSASHGVERIDAHSIHANGVDYRADCIVFATGFEINTTLKHRIGFAVTGREGRSLFEHWGAGLRTLHGHSAHGFPNWFFVGASQNAATTNYSGNITEQARHIAYILHEAKRRGFAAIEATAEAEAAWIGEIRKTVEASRAFLDSCTPGYYNNEGDTKSIGIAEEAYQGGAVEFYALLDAWRAQGDLQGMAGRRGRR